MTQAGDMPAQEVYELLAKGNFAQTGERYESGEYWEHVDRQTSLPIPDPVNGRLPRSVYDHIAALIDQYGR